MVSRLLFKAVSRTILHPLYRQQRGMTLGTRTAVFADDGRVLLVRHSYAPGWLLPGGGVERGETLVDAAKREIAEEAGIIAGEEPRLHGVFLNDAQFRGDHVAVFVIRRYRQVPRPRGLEIAETGFFPTTALPDGTTAGTRRRIDEILHGQPPTGRW